MNDVIGISTWLSILLIIFGVLFKVIDNSPTTWACFAFLCVFGIFRYSLQRRDGK